MIKNILSAASRTVEPFPDRHGPQFFNQQHLLACVGFRLYRDCFQPAIMAYLSREFPQRILIFGRQRRLPNWSTLYRFEKNLSHDDYLRFLENLRPLNSALVDLLELRRQMQVNLKPDLQETPAM